MSDILKIKLTKEIITDLHAFHRLNAIRELKKMAEETMAFTKENYGRVYDGYQVEYGNFVDGQWVDMEVLTPERMDAIEKKIDAITEKDRLKALKVLLEKMKIADASEIVDGERVKIQVTRLDTDEMEKTA